MRRTTMASFLRASLVLAAVVLPVFGQWELKQEFSDANCTTLTKTSYAKLLSCRPHEQVYVEQRCTGGKIATAVFSDKACGNLTILIPGEDVCSSSQSKKSCVDTLPDGYTKLDIEYYSDTVDCSGTPIAMSMGVKFGVCVPKPSGSEISTFTATTMTSKKYLTADCSGEANSTEDKTCGVCEDSMKIPCSSMPVAAAASAASGPAVSKVAVVALAGVAAVTGQLQLGMLLLLPVVRCN